MVGTWRYERKLNQTAELTVFISVIRFIGEFGHLSGWNLETEKKIESKS